MFKDPGDIDISEVQKSWEPDNEPQPSIIDSWGSHCVIAVPMRPTKTEHVKEKVVVVEEKTEPKSEKDTTETESFPSSIYENPEEFYYSNIYSEYETPISGTEKSIFSRTLSMSKDSLPLMAPTSSRNCQKSLCTKRNKRSCDKPNNKT